MSQPEIQHLKAEMRELNGQVYAGYKRIIDLLKEVDDLKETIESQQIVINALAESARGRDNKSNG